MSTGGFNVNVSYTVGLVCVVCPRVLVGQRDSVTVIRVGFALRVVFLTVACVVVCCVSACGSQGEGVVQQVASHLCRQVCLLVECVVCVVGSGVLVHLER